MQCLAMSFLVSHFAEENSKILKMLASPLLYFGFSFP